MHTKNHSSYVNRQSWTARAISIAATVITLALATQPAHATEEKGPEKEWTFLLFLNGHNNLDYFGGYNINQMEQTGSTDQLNLVVQWASLENGDTQRLYVTKDNDTNNVTSKAVETLAPVDMGDYKNLIDFVRWGVKNYPAKHYMIAVWNHGNGWHRTNFSARDISYDDNTGNKISTEQLGLAMNEAAKIIGHKVDIYGSDACLMAMGEVVAEMKDSVSYFVGSEEVEPGYGWPYPTWMKRWAANPTATPAQVSTFLTEEYLKAYNGGIYGRQDVTFSAFDVSKFGAVLAAVKGLNSSLSNLSATDMKSVYAQADNTMSFTYEDYRDLANFATNLSQAKIGVNANALAAVHQSVSDLVIANGGTGQYKNVKGLAIWIPTSKGDLSAYHDRYSNLEFNKATGWLSFLDSMNK